MDISRTRLATLVGSVVICATSMADASDQEGTGYTVLAWYTFVGGSTNDFSGNGNHAETQGKPTVAPGILDAALHFASLRRVSVLVGIGEVEIALTVLRRNHQ